VATVAAISIPVTIAITLAVLNALGVQLQTVSLAGLIVVLGMVVDNAIVIIDDHVDKLDHGMDPWTAAWKSAHELTVPVLAATIAIILSYIPMPLLVPGTGGDFLGTLPVTIAVALVTSMLVALLLIPVMNASFIRRGLHKSDARPSLLDRLQGLFDRTLDTAFRHPVLTLAMGVAAVGAALLVAAHIPQQMFPKVDRDQFAVEVYLPNGHSLKQTDAVIRQLEKELMADKRVENVTAFVGQSSPRFHTLYAPHMPARNYGQLMVNTVDDDATLAVLHDFQQRMGSAFPEAWVRWKQLDFQVGNPVEVRLSGPDIAALKAVAAKIENHARTIPGTTWVRNDYEDALQTIDIVPDADACARLGIPPAILQMSLALGSQGFPVGTIWEDEVPVRVLLKDGSSAATTIEGLRQQYVSSMVVGASVPLEQLASLHPVWNEGAIVRRNGVETLTVNVDVAEGTLASTVQKQVENYMKTLDLNGIFVEYGGERQMSEEIFTPMTVSMVVSIGLIFLVLIFQFKRFRKVLVTMFAMPLSLLGGFLGLLIAGYPFGLTAFVGIIGLLGIVVRNGIILVTYAEELRHTQGLNAKEAAIAAGKRRMRPIYLTSMAAAIGVVPMILSRSTLWGPLGTVTCFGLLLAMVLTLFVLPVAYWKVVGERGFTKPAAKTTAVVSALLLMFLSGTPTLAAEGAYTLAQCQDLALQNNAQIQESKLEIEAAQETREATYTKYYPQVSAAAAGVLAAKPLAEIHTSSGNLPVYDGNAANLATATQYAYLPSSTISMAEHATVFSLMAVQPLYMGGRVRNGNRLAEVGVRVANDKAVLARRDALAQTEEKYWRLITLAEKLRTLEAYEKLLESLQKQVDDGLAAGLLTRNDQLKVTLKRSEAAVDRRRLESGLRLSARDLRRHIGLPEGDSIALADGLNVPVDPTPLAEERQGAASKRPELHLLDNALRAEQLQTALKRGEMLPSLSLGAGVFRADVSGMSGSTNALIFGLLNVPLSELWEGKHATASQHRRELIAEKKLADTRELVNLEIDKTWSDLVVAWNAAQVSGEAIAQADVNLKEESDRYSGGLITFSDVLEAQVLRQQAVDHQVDARGDYWLKRSAYLRAVAREGIIR
jgi:outer membrane protein TolC/preprotein translocase subunit SecF